jgi:hypothetical protein
VPTSGASVAPESGPPGTEFVFSVSGFARKERLSYWATTPAGETLVNNITVSTDGDGNAVFHWTAPDAPLAGAWTMTVYSPLSGANRQVRFRIVLPNTPPADGVVPAAGPAGTRFRFGASGFEPNASLRRWTIQPDGTIGSENAEFNANSDGHVEFVWDAPATAVAGNWEMVIASIDSNITRRIAFRIEGAAPTPQQGVSPAEAAPGQELTFFVAGVPPTMLLDYWATDPSGVGEPVPHQVQADASGRAEWRWTLPANAAPGAWSVSVRRAQEDRSGGGYVQRQIFFTVLAD